MGMLAVVCIGFNVFRIIDTSLNITGAMLELFSIQHWFLSFSTALRLTINDPGVTVP